MIVPERELAARPGCVFVMPRNKRPVPFELYYITILRLSAPHPRSWLAPAYQRERKKSNIWGWICNGRFIFCRIRYAPIGTEPMVQPVSYGTKNLLALLWKNIQLAHRNIMAAGNPSVSFRLQLSESVWTWWLRQWRKRGKQRTNDSNSTGETFPREQKLFVSFFCSCSIPTPPTYITMPSF